MRRGNVINKFLNQNRFANTRTAEQTNLTTLGVGADQVHDFDAGLQNFGGGFLLIKGRCRTMNGPPLHILRGRLLIHRLPQQIEHTAQTLIADRYRNGAAGIHSLGAAHQAVRGGHGNAAGHIIANMLCNFHNQRFAVILKFHRIQQGGQFTVGKPNVQNRTGNLHNLTDVFLWHSTHSFVSFKILHQRQLRSR